MLLARKAQYLALVTASSEPSRCRSMAMLGMPPIFSYTMGSIRFPNRRARSANAQNSTPTPTMPPTWGRTALPHGTAKMASRMAGITPMSAGYSRARTV